MKTRFFPAKKRGFFDHGWLVTYHSFSFASFYDPDLMGFGLLRVVNDDTIAPGAGFGTHPHSDMEIVTIPLSGAVSHEDNTGGKGVVGVGEVQVMSAGTGVLHSEYNASSSEPLTLFQIWIEPARLGVPPRYDQKRFDPKRRAGVWQTLVSPFPKDGVGENDSLHIHQNAFISLGRFEAGQTFSYHLSDPSNGVFLMVVDGAGTVAEQSLEKRDALGMSETNILTGKMSKKGELLLIEVPME